jgi:HSP20 family protein
MSERDLFANFERMRRQMDELLGGSLRRGVVGGGGTGFLPPVDVAYTSEPARVIVTAELAGVVVADLDVQIQGRQLILSGRRGPPMIEGEVYQRVEIERGRFRRVVELAADVQAEEARASYEDGMLRIELPLIRREHRTRAVPIETSET